MHLPSGEMASYKFILFFLQLLIGTKSMALKMQCWCKCQIAAICRWLLSLPFPVKGLSASQWHGWLPLPDERTFEEAADGWTPLKWTDDCSEGTSPKSWLPTFYLKICVCSLPLAFNSGTCLISHISGSAKHHNHYLLVIRKLYSLQAKGGLFLDSYTFVLQPRAAWCP